MILKHKNVRILIMIKKILLPLLLLTSFAFITIPTISRSEFIDEEIEYEPDNLADIELSNNATRDPLDPITAVGIIALKNLQDFLRVPFYYSTQSPRRRPITDQPYLQFPDYTDMHTVKIVPIFHTNIEQKLTDDRSHLEYYVDLKQQFFVQLLSGLVGPVEELPNKDEVVADYPNLPEILALFAPLKTQEWQLGFDFQYFKNFDCINVFVQLPFVYQVNNYYLTGAERKAIENYPYIQDFFGEGDYWDFVRNNLICDKIGFGDTQIFIESTIIETYKSYTNVGLDILIPTSFCLKKGLIGTSFDLYAPYPSFDIYNDYLYPGMQILEGTDTGYNQQLVIDSATNLGFEILDRLSTILLEQPIGMQHFVIGLFTRTQMIFTPKLDLTSKTEFSCYLPGTENRFIRYNLNSATALANQIATGEAPANDEQAYAILDAFDEATLQHFFPLCYKTVVFPGLFFESDSQLTYHGEHWTFYGGSNTWWAFMNERFLRIDAPPLVLDQLQINVAKKINSYQSRIFIGADKNPYTGSAWTFGFRVSGSSLSWNIGPDFSIAGFLRYEF